MVPQNIFAGVIMSCLIVTIAEAQPKFSGRKMVSGLWNADCISSTEPARSDAIGSYDGFDAFPTRLCFNEKFVEDIIFWAKTNESGTSLGIKITRSNGRGLKVLAMDFDKKSKSNIIKFQARVSGKKRTCTIIKPPFGLSPYGEAVCE